MASKTATLTWALGEFAPDNKRMLAYRLYDDYYEGHHRFPFGTEKYKSTFWTIFRGYCDNMCASVVDVQAERLEVEGFTSSAATTKEDTVPGAKPGEDISVWVVEDPQGDAAWDEWEMEGLDLVSDQVHSDSLLYGDGFAIVDAEGVWRQNPHNMAVKYSQERPGEIIMAAKWWTGDDGRIRVTIYEPDKRTRYVTDKKMEVGVKFTPRDFSEEDNGPLPQGIPVVHFPNKKYGCYGISELKAVIPLQDALNKAEMDLIVAMEYQAFRQRWVAGVDVELGEDGKPKAFVGEHGPGRYLAFVDENTKTGEYSAADLQPYVKVINDFRGQIARVAGVPLHYFFVESGASESGESLKVGENRFSRKGKRQQRCFGKSWEGLMDLLLEVTAQQDDTVSYDSGVDLNILWAETSPRSESEELDVLVKKTTIGVPLGQVQKEAGYDHEQVKQFASERLKQVPATQPPPPTKVPVGETPGNATSQVSADAAVVPASANG